MQKQKKGTGPVRGCTIDEETHKRVIEAVKSTKYGQVTLIIQDSKIVQVDKTEKFRLK